MAKTGMVALNLTKKDLRYYLFYYRTGCTEENCPECGVQQETKIFYHIFDGLMLERIERILRRKVKQFRFRDYEHADCLHSAALHYFNPDTLKVGRVIKSWNRDELERLVPVKRKSKYIWYFVLATISCRGGDGKMTDRDLRSKSFPADSPELAVRKACGWLKRLEKRLKRSKKIEYIYEAALFHANRHRNSCRIPGTDSSMLNW